MVLGKSQDELQEQGRTSNQNKPWKLFQASPYEYIIR